MAHNNAKQTMALVGPFSGPRSDYGRLLKDAYNRAHHNLNVTCYTFDDEANPEKALQCAHDIINRSISIVVGHFSSFCAKATAPLYEKNTIPLLLPASTQQNLTRYHNVFRLCPHEGEMLNKMKALIKTTEEKTIAIVNDGSHYGDYLQERLSQDLPLPAQLNSAEELKTKPALKTIIILGIHSGMAAFINALPETETKLTIYCCDEAAIDTFSTLTKNSPHNIITLGPIGGYHQCSITAVKLAEESLKHKEPLSWLKTSGYFDANGEKGKHPDQNYT